jgi:DNA polymerase-1
LCEFGTAAAAFDDLDSVRTRLGAGCAKRLADPDARARWELNCQVMTMQDVVLELDGAAGPGVLPLDADRVACAFRAQELTWTVRDAVRVLAEVDAPPAQDDTRSWMPTWTSPPRLPRLPPKPAQLALFDL